MAFITAEIKIPEYFRTLAVRLYYPTDLPDIVGNEVKGVITLLHGMGSNSGDWMYMTAVCRYAADNGYVLVCPDASNSFYTDMCYGAPWYSIITEEIPRQLHKIFRLPTEREKNFIAGFSMGGYGALRIGMMHPERYAAIGSFSGALHIPIFKTSSDTLLPRSFFAPVWGDGFMPPEEESLCTLASKLSALPKSEQPRILCTCGEQDDDDRILIRTQNLHFKQCAESLPLDYTYMEWEGLHEWSFCDRSFAEFVSFIKGDGYAERKKRDWSAEVNP